MSLRIERYVDIKGDKSVKEGNEEEVNNIELYIERGLISKGQLYLKCFIHENEGKVIEEHFGQKELVKEWEWICEQKRV